MTDADDIYSRVPASSRATRFLRELLPALDALDPDSKPIARFTTASSRFLVGNTDNVTNAQSLHHMFKMRGGMLDKFYHRVLKVWEVPPGQEPQDRKTTVIFESASVTVLKSDKNRREVVVREVSILELVEDPAGVEGLVIREMRSYLDPKPVMDAMQAQRM